MIRLHFIDIDAQEQIFSLLEEKAPFEYLSEVSNGFFKVEAVLP